VNLEAVSSNRETAEKLGPVYDVAGRLDIWLGVVSATYLGSIGSLLIIEGATEP
jgi:hypothetical protein